MKIVDIKTKIIPSNPRSKNYPIGYSGGIASNSNGVTPDLSIYLLKEIWERNIEERTDESGNEYLYIRKPLAIGGGATMYASDGTSVPSIFDGLPLDNQTIWKNPTTGKIEVIGGSGSSFDENAMWSALSGSSDNQINKSHLTDALAGYATTEALNSVSNKLNDFLEGSDTDNIINKWKELEAFLSGMAEIDNLAEILKTKADRSYVDSTFVTIATEQDITAIKHFKKGLTIGEANKMIYEENGVIYIDANVAVTGSVTMYATGTQNVPSIYDGLPIDGNTIYWEEVEGSRVLKAKEGSGSSFDKNAMWTALAGGTTEQINKSHLTTALTGYATESWVTSKNYLTSVNIATISDLHANWDALLKAAPSSYVTRWPTISEVTDRKNLIIKLNGGSTEGTNLFTYNVTGEKTINITPAGIGAAASSHNHSWSNITSGKPSTLSGYGITDAYTKTESDNKYPTKTGSGASGTWGISITGNAGSSTKLQTAQKIWGQLFDGTKPVTGALTSVTDITGTGTFTGANLKATDSVYVNGIRLHKTADGVITLEGNLAVTGGVTMYAIDPVSASTIMDGVVVDGTTIKKENGKLVAVGGGEAGSVAWGNISGKPSVFATNIANITDLHSSWDSVLAAQKPAWLTAVSIATISDLHANWDALLKAAPSVYVTRWPTISEVTGKQNLIVKLNGGTTEGTNQFTYNATGAKTINITPAGIGAAASSHNHSWSNITSGKPTTLAGYGITDAPTKTGSGASGTWGINISGNASNADKLDNYHESSFFRARNTMNSSNIDTFALRENGTYSVGYGGYSGMLSVFKCGTGSIYSMEILSPYYETSHGLKFRYVVDGTRYTNWRSFAFEDGNVYSATKLQNKRYFWGQEFDGTTDVTGIIEAYNGIQLPYRKQIQTEYGTLLASGYNSESGYNDFFQLTAIGANKAARSLVGGNTGKLVWEGHQFIMTTYDGGWYMSDNEWMRTYNNKGVVCNDLWIDSRVRFGGNAEFGGNNSPNGVVFYDRTRMQRGIFAWYNDHFYMAKFENNKESTGYVAIYEDYVGVGGNLLVAGGLTLYGSDIRYKAILHQVNLSLLDIAKAPSFVYRWNIPNMNKNRINLGGSAQYTQLILPWAVENNKGFLCMDYATVAYTFAVHTARHLLTYESRTDKKIKKLENRVKYLEKQLKKLGYEEVRTLDDQSV